jgi:predicted nucleotidyltransferase
MAESPLPELPLLTSVERSCLARYLRLLEQTLADDLDEVVVFGSVARGESWPRGMPIRSDLDLLVFTHVPLSEPVLQELLDATLPLFLECGRQLSPQFRTREQLLAGGERAAAFLDEIARDGVSVLRRAGAAGK